VRPTSLEGYPELVNAVVGEILSRDSLVAVAEATNVAEASETDESADLIGKIRDAIEVHQDLGMPSGRRGFGMGVDTVIVAIHFEWSDPAIAADVANELSSRFISAHLHRQNRQARLTTDFLRREAERAEAELAQARARITAFTEAHRGELPSELDTKLARLERLQQQSQSLALQISDAEGRLLVLQGQEGARDAREVELEELRSRLAEERTVYTDAAPHVVALRAQIEAREAELAGDDAGARAAEGPAIAAVQREINALRAQASATERAMRLLDTAVAATPARQEELLALTQREQLLRERFIDASRKLQEAELAESLQQAKQGFQVSRLDAAIAPTAPKRPRWRSAVLALGAVLGVSVLTGLLLEFVDPVIVTARQLEAQTGAIPLGTISRIR
jgi:uncharacterized protein involved in exopolysaccharide biosynthesis